MNTFSPFMAFSCSTLSQKCARDNFRYYCAVSEKGIRKEVFFWKNTFSYDHNEIFENQNCWVISVAPK